MSDTIFALASGPLPAAIAVLRLSGPGARDAVERLLRGPLPSPRRASLRRLYDPRSGEVLDRGLVLWFPGPDSFTGEDAAELHVHGSRAVVAAAGEALAGLGLRPAGPGEFTRRAFDNGRLDLTGVEGLADLIQAETAAQRRQALRQMEGGLLARTTAWRERLLDALARLEAAIDFPDEDLPPDLLGRADTVARAVAAEMAALLAEDRRGEIVRSGFQVVILGPPNAGKSSLLNALARADVAIVSEAPGTTRDMVEVRLNLGGFLVTLVDTAGLRESADPVEREGVRRAVARGEAADLRLLVFDATQGLDPSILAKAGPESVVVANKIDLAPWKGPARLGEAPVLGVSARSGEGLASLVEILRRAVADQGAGSPDASPLSRLRHREAVGEALAALGRFDPRGEAALAAEDLRLALRAVGRFAGSVDAEAVLDRIFREFCIGK